MPHEKNLPLSELNDVLARVFGPDLLPVEEARVLIDTVVDAELRGVKSHGLSRVALYRQKLVNGSITRPATITRSGGREAPRAVAALDGHDGLGQWLAHEAMREAIEKAGQFGIGAVSMRNSQHFGTAGYYAHMATQRDMVGMAFTNASPRLAPWGAADGLLGNNPWAIGLPTHVPGVPFVLDISNAVTSAGRIRLAAKRGERIPDGWALDAEGRATTDPMAALGGILLPFGEHKGYGIALAVSMLTAVLAAGHADAQVQTMDDPDERQHVSHLFIALDVASFQDVGAFKERMRELIGSLHAARRVPGAERVFYPGERGYQQKERFVQSGFIPVDEVVWNGIVNLLN